MSEDRIAKLESQVAAMQQALYTAGLMLRPVQTVTHPVADAQDLIMTMPGAVAGVDLGVDLSFNYLCQCGETHSRQVTRVTGVRYGTIRTHTTKCNNGVTMTVKIQVPDDPAKQLVREALDSQF